MSYLDKCVPWSGAISSTGYGQKWHKGRQVGAHRWTWEQANGDIPADKMVLHKCDVKACVNLRHLYIGSRKDNARDASQRGQMASGERHGSQTQPEKILRGEKASNAKFTTAEVRQIRSLYQSSQWTLQKIATQFNAHVATIARIVRGETYAALNEESK